MYPRFLTVLWRRKLSFILVSSFLTLVVLWMRTLLNTAYFGRGVKDKAFFMRLRSQQNEILQSYQRKHFGEFAGAVRFVKSAPGYNKDKLENYLFEEERLRILQEQKERNHNNNGEFPPEDYDRGELTSSERQTQYEHELQKMGIPIVSSLGPEGPRPPKERLVHLDLKGAPPKLSFLKKIIPILKTLGATGILIEYEDMFPYSGSLEPISAGNAYKVDELKDFIECIITHGLNVIPLIQTFGHLEFALKLQGFEQMREIPHSPQSICPSQKESMSFIENMITQIVEFHLQFNKNSSNNNNNYNNNINVDINDNSVNHNNKRNKKILNNHEKSNDNGGHGGEQHNNTINKNSRRKRKIESSQAAAGFYHIHIGCDEVSNMGQCPLCRQRQSNELFLSHVITIASFIRNRWPQIKVIIWDDMLRGMTLSEMLKSHIGMYVEPMIWVYVSDIYKFIPPQLWNMYSKVFPTVWAASAFKGAFGEDLKIPPLRQHLENNLKWLAVISKEGGRFSKGFRGIVLTGWQRYDHFANLCELLPTAMPSLMLSLSTVSRGYFCTSFKENTLFNVLECAHPAFNRMSGYAWLELQPNSRSKSPFVFCTYPGSTIFNYIRHLTEKIEEIKIYLDKVNTNSAWMSEYNVRHNYTSVLRVEELTIKTPVYLDELIKFRKDGQRIMWDIFDQYTISEFLEETVHPTLMKLEKHRDNGKQLSARKTWPKRPLPYINTDNNYDNGITLRFNST